MICAENLIDLLSFLEQSDISDAMTLHQNCILRFELTECQD